MKMAVGSISNFAIYRSDFKESINTIRLILNDRHLMETSYSLASGN
jgi:hypothetical protein